MIEDEPEFAKRWNATWVFITVLIVCGLAAITGVLLLIAGTLAGASFLVTGLLFGWVSIFSLRRFASERREYESRSEQP
ncbi:hypothetical protein [Microbacterium sp. NPDC077184]|uniref:hypothetical protein n=1 Tax=Microbacterium sp. NPDC077184 TaxID=3154764 RepID=UPI003420932F